MRYHWRKEKQYFIVHLSQDLFGDWILTRSWGDCDSGHSQCRHDVMPSIVDAQKRINQIRHRQHVKGFVEQHKSSLAS